jgi:YHS domain-containing protein
MNTLISSAKILAALAAASLFAPFPVHAHEGHEPDPTATPAPTATLVPVSAKTDAAWLAKARATYGLDHCPVCGDKLDAKSPEYVYRQAGQPDRLVRFCDEEECVAKFKQDPEKFLKVIAEAAAEKAAAAKK